MINILLPFMGKSNFFDNYQFPKPLVEINGKTMLEHVISNFDTISNKRFIFIFGENECDKYHLDESAKLLAKNSIIIKLKDQTAGALCTCLMSIKHINNNDPLIIANSDQIIDANYQTIINEFINENVDSGIIVFNSIHPRWSYAIINGKNVVEVAEKRPISKNAIAGFYYYKKGVYYIETAKESILKNNSLNGQYYISSTINELILNNMNVGYYQINEENYHSFYSPSKIKEFEDNEKI